MKSPIRTGDESDIHDEPRIEGSWMTVQHVYERVEDRGLRPEIVAERLKIPLADIYEALAYYHRNSEAMQEIEEHRQAVAAESETLEKPE